MESRAADAIELERHLAGRRCCSGASGSACQVSAKLGVDSHDLKFKAAVKVGAGASSSSVGAGGRFRTRSPMSRNGFKGRVERKRA